MKQSVHSAGYYNKNGKEMNFTVEICREIIIMSEIHGIVFFTAFDKVEWNLQNQKATM